MPKKEQIAISLFDSHFEKVTFTCTIEPLFKLPHFIEMRGAKRGILPKNKLPLWSPASYDPKALRKKVNVRAVSCMVFDVDNGCPFSSHALFSDYRYYAHTTASHTESLHKWRLVMPLKKEVPGEHWERAWHLGAALFKERTGTEIDPACKNSDRMYYVAQINAQTFDHLGNAGSSYEYLELDYKTAPKPKKRKKVVSFTGRKSVTARDGERKIKESLRIEPAARSAAAAALNARISDNMARGIRCPQCQRETVWFFIDPNEKASASCNHQNSCAWFGSIFDLLYTGA